MKIQNPNSHESVLVISVVAWGDAPEPVFQSRNGESGVNTYINV
jgi:hypothetical protein